MTSDSYGLLHSWRKIRSSVSSRFLVLGVFLWLFILSRISVVGALCTLVSNALARPVFIEAGLIWDVDSRWVRQIMVKYAVLDKERLGYPFEENDIQVFWSSWWSPLCGPHICCFQDIELGWSAS